MLGFRFLGLRVWGVRVWVYGFSDFGFQGSRFRVLSFFGLGRIPTVQSLGLDVILDGAFGAGYKLSL